MTRPSRITRARIIEQLRLAARKGDRGALMLAAEQMKTLAYTPRYWDKYLELLANPLARLVDLLLIKQGDKIAHQKAEETELVEAILADGRETFVSSHLWSDRMCVKNIYATHLYPTYPEDLEMPQAFYDYYGYSDHSHGIEACLLAIARGARYIEKHFCLDKTDLATRDAPFSATPDEFAELVRIGRPLARLVGG